MPLPGKTLKNHHAECVIFVFQALKKPGFFHDEIEIPERVTISVIRLSGSLLTSRIIADSVKNSIEFLSQNGVFMVFVKF